MDHQQSGPGDCAIHFLWHQKMSSTKKRSHQQKGLNKPSSQDDENASNQPSIKQSRSNNQYWLLVGLLVGLAAFILSPQAHDRITGLSDKLFTDEVDDPNAPQMRVTIARAAKDSELNATIIGTRFISQKLFSELIYNDKGRFFDPFSAVQIKSWSQFTRWVTDSEKKEELGGDSPYLYFDPGEKKSSPYGSMLLGGGNSKANNVDKDESAVDELLIRNGDGGVPFIWPPLKVGHRVVRKDMPSPRGKDNPIIVETVNTSPKVYRFHSFEYPPNTGYPVP